MLLAHQPGRPTLAAVVAILVVTSLHLLFGRHGRREDDALANHRIWGRLQATWPDAESSAADLEPVWPSEPTERARNRLVYTQSDPPSDPAFVPYPDFAPSHGLERLLADFTPKQLATYNNLRRLFDESTTGLNESCGAWQHEYAAFHARQRELIVLGDTDGPRPLVYIADNTRPSAGQADAGGLADRQKGMATTFMLALLLSRPFFIYWAEPIPAEAVFESPVINWLWPRPDPPPVYDIGASQPVFERMNNFHMLALELEQLVDSEAALRKKLPDSWEEVHTNMGAMLYLLVRERPHSWPARRLRELGFAADNVYACVLGYLFRPLPRTRRAIGQYQAALAHPDVLSLSVHIRTNDYSMDALDEPLNFDAFRGFFGCAAALAGRDRPALPYTHALVHLTTDYEPLRRAFEFHPTALIDDWPDWLPPPIGLLVPVVAHHSTLEAGDLLAHQAAMQAAILEQAIVEAADRRVMSSGSGFVQISVLRAWPTNGPGNTVMLSKPEPDANVSYALTHLKATECDDPRAPMSLFELEAYWCCHL